MQPTDIPRELASMTITDFSIFQIQILPMNFWARLSAALKHSTWKDYCVTSTLWHRLQLRPVNGQMSSWSHLLVGGRPLSWKTSCSNGSTHLIWWHHTTLGPASTSTKSLSLEGSQVCQTDSIQGCSCIHFIFQCLLDIILIRGKIKLKGNNWNAPLEWV